MTGGAPTELHVLLLTDSVETAQLVPALLREHDGFRVHAAPATGAEALTAVSRYHPHVVVIGDTVEPLPLVVAGLDARSPELPLLAILPEGDVSGVEACSLAGARATLLKPFERQRLVAAIQGVYAREQRLRAHLLPAGATPARQQRPRVVAVHGVKGGVGTTTIACNLAAALRALTERRVALVDGDLLSGDAGVLFDLAPTRTLAELIPELPELDAEGVEQAFVVHPSGVHVLLAPEQLQRAEAIQAEDVRRAISSLRPYFDYQVVDTPSSLVPVTLAVLDEADLVVLVVTPELPALRNAARFLRLAAQLGLPSEKILLLANRADAGRQIDSAVMEEHLHQPVAGAISFDARIVVDCVNAGELLVAAAPGNRVSEGIETLTREVARRLGWAPPAPVPERRERSRPEAAPAGAAPAGATSPVLALFQRLARRLGAAPQ